MVVLDNPIIYDASSIEMMQWDMFWLSDGNIPTSPDRDVLEYNVLDIVFGECYDPFLLKIIQYT